MEKDYRNGAETAMKRDCSTCRDYFSYQYCKSPKKVGRTIDCVDHGTFHDYRPRPYWTPSERAGLKAMGELYRNAAKLRETIATIIYAYVDAARRVKDGGR